MHAIYSDTLCDLGESPLWHPEEGALYWVDIIGKKLLRRDTRGERIWHWDRHISALGWVDAGKLLVATETDLVLFDTETETETRLAELEETRAETRSNDGRADPWGGFWISTMAKDKAAGAGAIYRFFGGEVRKLYDGMSIPNSICFAPGGAYAYFGDSDAHVVRRVTLDEAGWPARAPETFLDLSPEGLRPDGAVVDSHGNLWSAQAGAGRVACYTPEGRFMTAAGFASGQTTCPAFGGADLKTLFVTTAAEGAGADDPLAGVTFAVPMGFSGQRANRVVL
ncbi:SMP-30/gluconolactonase/LRE family protein [Roseivivax marinus]|uniref:SMP-30/gluconolactonase/LRE family protein n=1 Tax=Roseivivax marinus TaxID=1379903 RepID=UPI001F045715|nr:SMP-30/gluconolactonase/LRE family protein [Roseivivax marinus]UMA66415.1 SMP-30/gluconolactonase/LRE family protein [Roseivivax marinus]